MISKVKIAYHRNGVGGNGFHVLTFHDSELKKDMVGIVFDEPGSVAVFDRKLLGEGVIEFGVNSWRGDSFEPALRAVIAREDEE